MVEIAENKLDPVKLEEELRFAGIDSILCQSRAQVIHSKYRFRLVLYQITRGWVKA